MTAETIRIGKHTLTCGDSRDMSVPDECDALMFDPPWDADYTMPKHSWKHRLVFTDPSRLRDVIAMCGAPTWLFIWDCVSCWYTPSRPLKRAKLCCWYGPLECWDDTRWLLPRPTKPRIVRNSRGEYFYEGGSGTRISEVYTEPLSKRRRTDPHEKPEMWITGLMAATLPPGSVVYDPYAGSGVTMIAADRIGLASHLVEIVPDKCAEIERRYRREVLKEGELCLSDTTEK